MGTITVFEYFKKIWMAIGGFGVLLTWLAAASSFGVGAGIEYGPTSHVAFSGGDRNDWYDLGVRFVLLSVCVFIAASSLTHYARRESLWNIFIAMFFILYGAIQLKWAVGLLPDKWPANFDVPPLLSVGFPFAIWTMTLILSLLGLGTLALILDRIRHPKKAGASPPS